MRMTMAQEYNRRRVQAMSGWQVAVPVPYDGIGMDGEAARRLRETAAQVAADADVPVAVVARRLFDYAYRLEPTGALVLLVGVPERGVEVFVEMGAQHWRPVRPGEGEADGAPDTGGPPGGGGGEGAGQAAHSAALSGVYGVSLAGLSVRTVPQRG